MAFLATGARIEPKVEWPGSRAGSCMLNQC